MQGVGAAFDGFVFIEAHQFEGGLSVRARQSRQTFKSWLLSHLVAPPDGRSRGLLFEQSGQPIYRPAPGLISFAGFPYQSGNCLHLRPKLISRLTSAACDGKCLALGFRWVRVQLRAAGCLSHRRS